ncbi:hypothetical protein TrLO_g246 [Triparma laevis f. longispina]|uniref:Uncharacterized protein n=1 Tax=Triparma laevis f. longispina TaxID=1714387 RepID=A0A9W7A0H0_9STRA|nr:hypothetical protein TrLO_g246 [Triparma laevis f. longispina]
MSNKSSTKSTPVRVMNSIRVLDSMNSTAGDLDKGLKLLGYTCNLLTILLSPSGRDSMSNPTSLTKGLLSMHDNMSIARYALRIVNGMPSTVGAVVDGSWEYGDLEEYEHLLDEKSDSSNRISSPLAFIAEKSLPYSMLGYYPLEAIAYFGWMAPGLLYDESPPTCHIDASPFKKLWSYLRSKENHPKTNLISAASCAFWLWYIIADIIVQSDRVKRLSAVIKELEESGNESKEKEEMVEDLKGQLVDSKVMLTRECFFLLPGVHWSLPTWDSKPLLPRWLLTSLMFGEAATGFVHSYFKKERALLGK